MSFHGRKGAPLEWACAIGCRDGWEASRRI